jgi:hypothetical protein
VPTLEKAVESVTKWFKANQAKLEGATKTASMAVRVAALFVRASLKDELTRRMDRFFSHYDDGEAAGLADWFRSTFRFDSPKTPKGQKALKELADKFHYFLRDSGAKKDFQGNRHPGNASSFEQAKDLWRDLEPKVDDLIRYFTDEGGVIVPKEIKLGSNTYHNEAGLVESDLLKFAKGIEQVFDELKGWRKKALAGGVDVVFAGPEKFTGTVAGKYRSAEDKLYVRATPKILKRTRGTYGALDYILVHELGHRYGHKNRVPEDFDKPHWQTTKYSRNEGESFAELFALSNFGLTGPWDPAILERFDKLMG